MMTTKTRTIQICESLLHGDHHLDEDAGEDDAGEDDVGEDAAGADDDGQDDDAGEDDDHKYADDDVSPPVLSGLVSVAC